MTQKTQQTIIGFFWLLVMVIAVGASLYRLLAGSLGTFSEDLTGQALAVAFALALGAPLSAWFMVRRTRSWVNFVCLGVVLVLWIVLLAGSFVGDAQTMGMVGLALAVVAYLTIYGIYAWTSPSTRWLVRGLLGGGVLVLIACAAAAGFVDMDGGLRAAVVSFGYVVMAAMVCTVTWLERTVELPAAQIASYGSRVLAGVYQWSALFYVGCALLALPLTIVAGRFVSFSNVSVASYGTAAGAIVLLAVLLVVVRMQWISPRLFTALSLALIIVALSVYLLTNNYTVFLQSADSLFIIGIMLLACFAMLVVFGPHVAPTAGLLIARFAGSWLAAATLGVGAIVMATGAESEMALAFMPLDTFLAVMAIIIHAIPLAVVVFDTASGTLAMNAASAPATGRSAIRGRAAAAVKGAKIKLGRRKDGDPGGI